MSSSRPSEPLLLPLGCPSCGGGLDPLHDDVLFLCGAAGGASESVGPRTVRRELRHATPSSEESILHLPFWRLSASAVAPAFNGSRLLTVSRWYSERVPDLDAGTGGPAPRGLWGGRIGAADAPRLVALASESDSSGRGERRKAPTTTAAAPVLFAVPFHREPSHLVCALTGFHLYLETLEASAELLARWDRLLSEA